MTATGALGADFVDQPTGDELAWQERGVCRGMDSAVFFPEERNSSKLIQQAKQICRHCEVWRECQQWALTRHEEFGVWGGLSEPDRRRIWKRMKQSA